MLREVLYRFPWWEAYVDLLRFQAEMCSGRGGCKFGGRSLLVRSDGTDTRLRGAPGFTLYWRGTTTDWVPFFRKMADFGLFAGKS